MGIETALLGAAATKGVAATGGLLGSGGALFGIKGLTASALSTGASVLGGISSIAGGASANAEAKRQAQLATFQAQEQGKEAARLAQRDATLIAEEADSTRRRQKVAYMKSGVTLEGSPLLVMEGTRARGQQNVEEALQAGGAGVGAAMTEGRIRAQNVRAQGRQAFISGLTGAASMFKSAF